MAIEASLHPLDATTSEPLTAGTCNLLTWEARSFHYGARIGESYGDFRVTTHTEDSTVMIDSDRDEATRLAVDVVPFQGVLLRNCYARKNSQDILVAGGEAVLLNSFREGPRILREPLTPAFTSAGRLGSYPVDKLVRVLLAEGTPLNEGAAGKWIEYLQDLSMPEEHESKTDERRTKKVAGMIHRLIHHRMRHV